MGTKVLGEFVNPLGHQGDLDLGRAGVAIAAAVLADQLALFLFGQAHLVKTPCTRRGSRPLESSTDAPGVLYVTLHLLDQLLHVRIAALAAQALDESDAKGPVVEVLFTVDQVG